MCSGGTEACRCYHAHGTAAGRYNIAYGTAMTKNIDQILILESACPVSLLDQLCNAVYNSSSISDLLKKEIRKKKISDL